MIPQQTCILLYTYMFAGVEIARRCFPDGCTAARPIEAIFHVSRAFMVRKNERFFKWWLSCDQDGCHAHIELGIQYHGLNFAPLDAFVWEDA